MPLHFTGDRFLAFFALRDASISFLGPPAVSLCLPNGFASENPLVRPPKFAKKVHKIVQDFVMLCQPSLGSEIATIK